MGKEDEIETIEKEEEFNEELEKIKEKVDLIKFEDIEKDPFSGRLNVRGLKEREEIIEAFPRAITNNELPDGFYDYKIQPLQPFFRLFSKLELAGITRYHKKTFEFFESVPKLKILGLSPYANNFDGQELLENNPFLGYTDGKRLELLEFNKESTLSTIEIISSIQAIRLGVKKFKLDNDGYKFRLVVIHNTSIGFGFLKKFIEENLDSDFSGKMDEILDEAERLNETKINSEESNQQAMKVADIAINFAKEIIPRVRQKMKENYESQKK